VLAILHTFAAARFTAFAHAVQHRHDEHERANGRKPTPSPKAEVLHFFGEVEVIFGLWAVILFVTAVGYAGWEAATHYVNSIAYTEALFVVVIMALASTRPVISFAESTMSKVARLGSRHAGRVVGDHPDDWTGTRLLHHGSGGDDDLRAAAGASVLRPGTVRAAEVRDARSVLFVNVSIGGTLTPFAAPPVLMVARPWGWDVSYMVVHFGWRAVVAILISTACISSSSDTIGDSW
jgi:hypothetical protein